jgi:hypothetical protein
MIELPTGISCRLPAITVEPCWFKNVNLRLLLAVDPVVDLRRPSTLLPLGMTNG